MQELKKRALELMESGKVARVLGWKQGEFSWEREPAFFYTQEALDAFAYDVFSGSNVSKYMIGTGDEVGKTLVFLKPCDTYSFNQLIKEHRVKREHSYIIGVGCHGNVDMDKINAMGIKGILDIDVRDDVVQIKTLYGEHKVALREVLLERCLTCKGKEHMAADETIGESEDTKQRDPLTTIMELESMTSKERFEFFRNELSKCIRCNACRNVCPACSCRKCVFDSNNFDSERKVNTNEFEENMFHIIRAFHVAGRCTDCGECSRVCPQNISLHLFNRKLIKDMNTYYGTYQAGADTNELGPLNTFEKDDIEASQIVERG